MFFPSIDTLCPSRSVFQLLVGAISLYAMSIPASAQHSVGTQQLQGHVLPAFASAPDVGPLDATTVLHVAVSLPLRNLPQLNSLQQAATNPASAQYRHFFSPSEFDAQFAPTQEDYNALQAFAQANGLAVETTYAHRMVLDLTGRAAAIQQAFHTELTIHRRNDGSTFFAPNREPSLNLTVPILHISGLDNFMPPRRTQTGTGFNGSFTGGDLRNAYVPGVTEKGEGQTVGVIEFDGFYTADPLAYENQFGLSVPIDVVTLSGFSQTTTQSGPNGSPGGNQDGEVAGDIQMAMALAPNLALIIVYEGSTIDSVLAAASSPQNGMLPHQLSMSWNLQTDSGTAQLVQRMGLLGQTFFVSSGDGSAFPCPVTQNPPQSPAAIVADDRALDGVTVVGGSQLTMNGATWASETAAVGGGGIMTGVNIPPYQGGLANAANGGSQAYRMIPDVALSYYDNFDFNTYVNATGQQAPTAQGSMSGTSASTPLWASLTALLNQRLDEGLATAGTPIGYLNLPLYGLGNDKMAYGLAFHDITYGNNTTTACGGYNAVSGYDLVTGWGTPTAQFINTMQFHVALAQNPAIAVRSNGEADIVAQGPGSSLMYYSATPGSPWSTTAIAGSGTTFSAPAIAIRPTGEADIVAMGPAGELLYYYATPGSPWSQYTIAGTDAVTSAPSIVVRENGEADVVARGKGNTLQYYHATPGSSWSATTIAGGETTFSAPAIAVRADGEADIVAQGPNNSLLYYHATPGSAWSVSTIAGDGTTVFAPAIAVRSNGEADVVAQGPNNSLSYYHATPGSAWSMTSIAVSGTTFSAPAISVRQDGEVDVVAQGPNNSLIYYYVKLGSSSWTATAISGNDSTLLTPTIAIRPSGEADVVSYGANRCLQYLFANPGTAWFQAVVPGGCQAPEITVSATETQTGPDVCVAGGGLTPGSKVASMFFGIPGRTSPLSGNSSIANPDGSFNLGLTTTTQFLAACNGEQQDGTVSVIVNQNDSSGIAVESVRATFPAAYFCSNVPVSTNFNGGCQ